MASRVPPLLIRSFHTILAKQLPEDNIFCVMNSREGAMKVVLAPSIVSIMDRARIQEGEVEAHCFYLGSNYLKAQETLAWAVSHAMVAPPTARLFREACVRIKPEFLDLMGNLAEEAADPEWWATPVSSKSPYLSPLFFCLAWLDMVRSYVESARPRALFLVIEHPALADVLETFFAATGAAVRRWRGRPRWSVRWAWEGLVRSVTPRWKFLKEEWMKRRALRSGGCSRRAVAPDGPVALIRSWYFPVAASNGRFHDVYFEGLPDRLRQAGVHPLTVVCLNRPADAPRLAELLRARRDLVAFDLIVPMRDVLAVWIRTLVPSSFRPSRALFCGVDVRPLIRSEIQKTAFDPVFVFSLLHRRLVRRLRGLQWRIGAAYLPFENQPWEKMFCLELKRSFPGVWIGAYH